MTRREKILLAVFAGIAALSFILQSDDAGDLPVSSPPAPAIAAKRFPDASAQGNLFPGQIWTPPVTEQPLQPPESPAFPFDYLGLWREQETEIVFLSAGAQVIRVRQGDVIQNTWRLDQVSQQQLVFTYLPLKMTKTMRIPQ